MADMGTKEAAEKWGVSQIQVQKWRREGKIPDEAQDKKRALLGIFLGKLSHKYARVYKKLWRKYRKEYYRDGALTGWIEYTYEAQTFSGPWQKLPDLILSLLEG